MNPSSIYAYLDSNDKDLQKVTGLFPVPAGPKGTVNQIDTWSYGAFKKNPYPDLARGLIEYFMQPSNYDVPVSYAGAPTPAAGEVLNTHVIPKMIQRVLVENWEPAKALEECDKRIVEIYARYKA